MKRMNKILAALLAALLILSLGALAEEAQSTAIDKEAFDALVASGPVADDETVAASQWASKVKA